MIKLSTQTTQTIKFIPRQGIIECLVIENEATSEQVKLDLTEVVDVLGEELIINSEFDTDSDWIKGVGFSIQNESLIATNTLNNSITYQSKTYLAGTYRVVANVTLNNGGFRFQIGGSNASEIFTTGGIKEFDLTISSNQSYFGIICKEDASNFSIDNVSVKEKVQDTEINYITLDNHTELEINVTEGFLQEGQTYTLKALDSSSNVLFYDKVFCTDQTDYTINKDEFKSYSQSETYKTFKG